MIRTRRELLVVSLGLAFVGSPTSSVSASLDTLTSRDATGGLRAALSQGIDTAVTQLGALVLMPSAAECRAVGGFDPLENSGTRIGIIYRHPCR